MLYRKNIEKRCAYCEYGAPAGPDEVLCERKGIVSAMYSCRKYRYDALKRVPPRPARLDSGDFNEDDFSID